MFQNFLQLELLALAGSSHDGRRESAHRMAAMCRPTVPGRLVALMVAFYIYFYQVSICQRD